MCRRPLSSARIICSLISFDGGMGSVYNWDMKREGRRQRKLYIDIIAVIAMTVLLAVFFTWKFQQSSEGKVLNTLSEISCQSVNVIQEEVEKNKTLLTNLAI